MNWFLPIILSLSMSVRTANVQPNPMDYQFAFSSEKKDEMMMAVERESELGKLYVNEEYWVKKASKRVFDQNTNIVLMDRYVNQSSRGILYNQAEVTLARKNYRLGYALRHVNEIPSHRITAGWELDKAITGLSRLTIKIHVNSDFKTVDMDSMARFDIAFFKFINIYAFGRNEKLGNKSFFQLKIGVSSEIPQMKGA